MTKEVPNTASERTLDISSVLFCCPKLQLPIHHHLWFTDMVLGVEGGYDSEDREEAEIHLH